MGAPYATYMSWELAAAILVVWTLINIGAIYLLYRKSKEIDDD